MLAKKPGDFTVEVSLLGQQPSAVPRGQGDQPWLASPLHRNGPAEPIPLWPAWLVPIPTVATSTPSAPATSAWSSGSASTSTSDACTAPPAAIASANAKEPSCGTPRSLRRPSSASSSAWGTGARATAAADIGAVDPRTVTRLWEQGGRRAVDCHDLQRERIVAPPEAVQLDELHGRETASGAAGRGRAQGPRPQGQPVARPDPRPVRSAEGHPSPDRRVGMGPENQHLARGTVQWDAARSPKPGWSAGRRRCRVGRARCSGGCGCSGTSPTGFGSTALRGRTPAMAMRLTDHIWTVLEYIRYPVHVDDLKREIWAEERREVLTSPLEREKPQKTLPTS